MEYSDVEISRGGLYVITNLLDGKFYVGSTVNFFDRWTLHLSNLKKNKHHSPHLQNAWNKYGEENFSFLPLQCISDKNDRLKIEQHFLDTLKPPYNVAKKATSCEGTIRSEETRKKMSIAVREPKRLARFTEYAKLPKSEEQKRKISEAHIGLKASEETKAKLRAIWVERKLRKQT